MCRPRYDGVAGCRRIHRCLQAVETTIADQQDVAARMLDDFDFNQAIEAFAAGRNGPAILSAGVAASASSTKVTIPGVIVWV